MHPKSISQEGLELVKQFEGLHEIKADGLVHSYVCPAGVHTLGWGATKGITSQSVCTIAEAEKRLIADLKEHADEMVKLVTVPLTQGQYDALVSFVFNLGVGANFRNSTLLKKLNQGLYDEVPEQFMRWNKATVNGKRIPLAGLTRRRAAESAIFMREALMPSDKGGERMAQSPEMGPVKSLTKSKTMAGAGIAGAATALNEVSGQLEGLIAYSDSLQTLFVVFAIGGIALAAYARWKDNKV
jgi:lysozyme